MSGVMRLSEVTRGYPEPTRAQMPQNATKRGKACFLLFLIEQNFYFVQYRVPKKRLPRWSRDAVLRIIADEQMFVKQVIMSYGSINPSLLIRRG